MSKVSLSLSFSLSLTLYLSHIFLFLVSCAPPFSLFPSCSPSPPPSLTMALQFSHPLRSSPPPLPQITFFSLYHVAFASLSLPLSPPLSLPSPVSLSPPL